MSVLVLRLAGPMQSWGLQSRHQLRDTAGEPTKSGVMGLVAAALGRSRQASVSDLMGLAMTVRIDRGGTLQRDFQTAGGGQLAGISRYGVATAGGGSPRTSLSTRYYLADADFRVALDGDAALLKEIAGCLNSPRWPLFLGRKSFVPSAPLLRQLYDDRTGVEVLSILEPWYSRRKNPLAGSDEAMKLKLVVERRDGDAPSGGLVEVRQDVIDRFDTRDFRRREVEVRWMEVDPKLIEEDPTCIFLH
jgi:CRISPR system Cascade subunit CasD